jgi:DNA sulfur modification protein DndC
MEMLQCLRKLPNRIQLAETLARITGAYKSDNSPWIVGYSGGKDSTAIVKLSFQSLVRIPSCHKQVTVIYCDTGVEVPMASALARKALKGLVREARKFGLPINAEVLSPVLSDRFFVKVIGRGYPPPTDKFRWCTDRLRIDPVTRFLEAEQLRGATVVLGVRESESSTRQLTLAENRTTNRYWKVQRGIEDRRLFMPILDYTVHEVWLVNLLLDRPRSLRAKEVAKLYVDASSECPTVRELKGAPCGKARFGCWTCTVAKNGTTLRNLIANGQGQLLPLLNFRLWLERERDNPRYRWEKRRNGQQGPGPMRLEWRRLALRKLLKAQNQSGLELVTTEEISAIYDEWTKDDA